MAASRSASGSTRLTRSTRKKIRATTDADSGVSDPQQREEEDVLLNEYEAFQHGLPVPSKRRRLSSAAARSRSGSATSETDSTPSASTAISKDADEPAAVTSPTSAAEEKQPAEADEKAPSIPVEDAVSEATTEKAEAVKAEGEEEKEAEKEPVKAIAEVALATEEKALDGAPEGELYVVTVLASDEITASADVEAELKEIDEVLAVKAAAAATTDDGSEAATAHSEELSWAKEYAALDSIRRLALHHKPQLTTLLQETSVMVTLVCPAAMNLRSAMARNALLCIQDIVEATRRDAEQFFGEIVPLLVQRTGNEKQFIRDLARDVLLTCIEHCPTEALLSQLLRIATAEKNAQIVSSAGVYAQKCMEKMDKSELKALATTSRETFFDEMSAFLNCKVVDCKVATRKALQSLRKTLGDAQFTTLVKTKLEGTAQFELLKASEVKRPTIAKSGLPKLSMRERMMQMKKQQAAAGDDAAVKDKVDDVIVVAVPSKDVSR